MWLPLAALLLGVAPGAEDARALFQRMEQQVLKSKTFTVQVDFDIEQQKPVTGRLLLAGGNRMRLEIDVSTAGKAHKAVTVSDGTRMRTLGAVPRKNERTPDHLTPIFLSSVTRGGVWLTMIRVLENQDPAAAFKDFDLDKDTPVSDFKLGPKEQVSGKEAQVVEYTINRGADALIMAVWIDVATNLPLKRVVKAREKDGADQVIMTETYRLTLDEKIDDKEFKVPR